MPFVFFSVDDHPDYHRPTDDADRIPVEAYAAAVEAIVDAFIADVRNDRIGAGFCSAVQKVGDVLAAHFPSDAKNPNELPDRLFVI